MVGGEGERAGIVRQLWVEGGVRAWPWCNPFLHVTTRKFSCVTAEADAAYTMFIHTFIYKSISQTSLLPPFLAYSLPHQASNDLLDLFSDPDTYAQTKETFSSARYIWAYLWTFVWPRKIVFGSRFYIRSEFRRKKTDPDTSLNKIFNLSYENFY